ncbi:hypothetical protein GCM10027452_35880 [Micromonospora halotolerans]
MNPVQQAIVWLNDPLNWSIPGGILDRLGEHLTLSALAVLLGCVVAWPIGLWLGHTGRGGGLVLLVSNVTLAIPTLALLTILPLTFLGFGRPAVVVALAVFAVPPLLATAYTGVRQADPEAVVVEAHAPVVGPHAERTQPRRIEGADQPAARGVGEGLPRVVGPVPLDRPVRGRGHHPHPVVEALHHRRVQPCPPRPHQRTPRPATLAMPRTFS